MPINRDLSEMKPEQQLPVNAQNRVILNRIGDYFEGSPPPSTPPGTLWRGSQAGHCAKQVAYESLRVTPSNPITPADYWRMGLGSIVHTHLHPALERWLKDDESIVLHEEYGTSIGDHGYGHVDMVLETSMSEKIVIELKTINGTGFKKSIQGQGPRHDALLQGALYAHALKADLLVICYLAVELLSPGWAEAKGFDNYGRFGAEWHYTPEEFVPLAKQEMDRLEWIGQTAHGVQGLAGVPRMVSESDPDIPAGAEIYDPSIGAWKLVEDGRDIAKGRTWRCGYCSYQDDCVSNV